MAKERDRTLDIEHSLNIQFFDVLVRLNTPPQSMEGNHILHRLNLNHSRKNDLLAISLPEIYQLANEQRYNLPPQSEMQEALRQSREYKFIAANKVVDSKNISRSIRCWVFEQSKTHPIN